MLPIQLRPTVPCAPHADLGVTRVAPLLTLIGAFLISVGCQDGDVSGRRGSGGAAPGGTPATAAGSPNQGGNDPAAGAPATGGLQGEGGGAGATSATGGGAAGSEGGEAGAAGADSPATKGGAGGQMAPTAGARMVEGGAGGAAGTPTQASGAGAAGRGPDLPNQPPVPVLFYEIDLNIWVPVREGDVVVRPLDSDINWGACTSYDPDGTIVRITLIDGLTTQIQRPGGECILEHTETNHDPRDLVASLRVEDNDGAVSTLRFTYRTE